MIRTGTIKLLHTRREYKCVKCGHTFSVNSNFETRNEMDMPLECPSDGLAAKACGGYKFEMVEGSETCRDYQEVRIQEQVHKLSVGSIPRSISLALFDDLVDRCKPGDDVSIARRHAAQAPLAVCARCATNPILIQKPAFRRVHQSRSSAPVTRRLP